MKTLPPKIGIVSGIGPLAGSDVLNKVFKNAAQMYGAVEDSQYPDLLLLNRGIEGIDNFGSLSKSFEEAISDMVHQLEAQGATIVGIACNTAHVYLHKIKTKPHTVLVNLIDTVASVASEAQNEYLLLTSAASKQQKLYHGYLNKHSVSYTETSPEQQLLLDKAIGLVMAHKLSEAGKFLDEVLEFAEKAGTKAVITGCTELPIAIAHSQKKSDLKIVDSNEELARALLKEYYRQI